MRTKALLGCALAGLIAALTAVTAGAESLDLADRSPRWVGVTFEISGRDLPGQIDTHYSESFAAHLRPGETPGLVEIAVPSSVVEEHLLSEESPLPGSFSDFVWVFDTRSGEVVSATVSGTVVRTIDWGIAKTRATARIRVSMSTRDRAGFEAPTRILGQTYFRHCSEGESESCNVVDAVPFDPSSGYVNAVGEMKVRSSGISLSSFSPMGEAIFRELDELDGADSAPAVAVLTVEVN